jgi:Ca2+:H+ antiporter
MNRVRRFLSHNPFTFLLLVLPFVPAAQLSGWSPVVVFFLACLGIIPLAAFIGESTETLAAHTSPRIGALLNATFGNAAELIITITAVRAGLLELVKASITGSILGNLLMVLGFSMVVGGVKHGTQTFNRTNASRNAILLVLSVVALVIPSLLSGAIGPEGSQPVEILSLGVAVLMMLLYGLGLLAAARVKDSALSHTIPETASAHWSRTQALIILAISTAMVVWLSEVLVHVTEDVITNLGISEFFVGMILVPLIGNVAEHLAAVQVAAKNKMDLSVEIAISSSLQIALFVAPLLVFISLAVGHPLQIVFNQFELIALLAGVLVSALVSADGESTWLEGSSLLVVYLILALAFFLFPS